MSQSCHKGNASICCSVNNVQCLYRVRKPRHIIPISGVLEPLNEAVNNKKMEISVEKILFIIAYLYSPWPWLPSIFSGIPLREEREGGRGGNWSIAVFPITYHS